MSQTPTPSILPPPTSPSAPSGAEHEGEELLRKMRSGAGWFFWIAALSLINSVMVLINADRQFGLGMAFTLLVDVFANEAIKEHPDATVVIRIIELLFDAVAITGCVVVGIFAGRGHRWAFIVGLVLYGIDSLIALLLMFGGDVILGIIHIVALAYIGIGFAACLKIHKLAHARAMASLSEPSSQATPG